MERILRVLEQIWLDDVSDLKIIDKSVLKFTIPLRVSQEYGVLQLSYETASYFNSASQAAMQCMFSDWQHEQQVRKQREQCKYDFKKKHQKP